MMNRKKYKPLYKKYLKLRSNIPHSDKILRFNKSKWRNLINSFRRSNRTVVNLYDQAIYFRSPKSTVSRSKYNFRNSLSAKQTLKLMFGGLTDQYLSSLLSSRSHSSSERTLKGSSVLSHLESRLDTILYRSGFVRSFRGAKQVINFGAVYINDRKVKTPSYVVKLGDKIHVSRRVHSAVRTNLASTNFKAVPAKYLHINYRTLEIFTGSNSRVKLNPVHTFLGLQSPLKF